MCKRSGGVQLRNFLTDPGGQGAMRAERSIMP
jgi:hypothetical protein